MLLKLLIIMLIIYLGSNLIKSLLFPPQKKSEVKGRPVNKPLDLSGKDVEDAQFEDIEE